MKKDRIIEIVLGIIALILVGAFSSGDDINLAADYENNIVQEEKDGVEVHFIDVGQADCILVKEKDKSMLIDAGNNDDGKEIVSYIKDLGINKIDYLIATHAHEDHIGGIDNVIEAFEIGKMFMPEKMTTTKTFEEVLDSVEEKDVYLETPEIGDIFYINDAKCEVMSIDSNAEELNQTSIVIQMNYGSNSFLFMGDAETANENARNWNDIDVLKVGHHGSNSSSSERFLNQVKPEISIIQVGEDNKYNLPTSKTLNKLEKINSKIYRNDLNGNIILNSNGIDIEIKTDR